MRSKRGILVIGLDGATFDLIKPWVDSYKLPSIRKLMENGVHGPLKSCIPPITFPAWKCYSTGKNPGKLGVFGFEKVDIFKKKFSFVDSTFFDSREIWDIIGNHNLRSIVFNMPSTYPPKRINGIMISGPFTRSSNFAYPKKIIEEIDRKLGKYEPGVSFLRNELWKRNEIPKKLLEKIEKKVRKKFMVIKYLLNNKRWDFFHATIFLSDVIQHRMWKEPDKLMEFWMHIDEELKGVLETVPDSNIFLMSDHGFGSNESSIYINDWLEQEGYLVFRRNLAKLEISETGIGEFLTFLFRRIGPLVRYIPRFVLHGNMGIRHTLDWEKTRAFALADGATGQIYINRNVVRTDEECEELKKDIVKKLKAKKYVPLRIYEREDIFSGEYVKYAPDLIVMSENQEHPVVSRVIDQGFDLAKEKNWYGSHRMSGIFIACGPDIEENKVIENVEIVDLAPTILHILGVPIPKDMDGKVLKEIFRPSSDCFKKGSIFQEPLEKKERKEYKWSKEEEEEIQERLRKLGYI